MRQCKMTFMLVGALLVMLMAGCGSTAPVQREAAPGPASGAGGREGIINEHNALAEQKRQELRGRQEIEAQGALSGVNSEEQEAIVQLEQQLKSDLEAAREEAEATLSDDELVSKMQELQDKYDSDLAEETAGIRSLYDDKREQKRAELAPGHQQELDELNAQLATELQQKLVRYGEEQTKLAAHEQARLAAAQAEQDRLIQEEQARRQQEAAAQPREEPVTPTAQAQPTPAVTPAPAYPVAAPMERSPGTRAPVKPIVVHKAPPVTEKGLRREGDAPLGQRRYYVNKYFRTGEALQKIQPSEELNKRERHEMVITFWMEGTPAKAAPKFMLNGIQIYSWQEIEENLAGFRASLINEHYLLYAKVILDQRRDVPRSVVDDILSVCFKVGIRHISMGSGEPRMEQ